MCEQRAAHRWLSSVIWSFPRCSGHGFFLPILTPSWLLTPSLPRGTCEGSGGLLSQPHPCERTLLLQSPRKQVWLSPPRFLGGPFPWERRLAWAGHHGRGRVLSPVEALVFHPREGGRKEGGGQFPGAGHLLDGWSRICLGGGGGMRGLALEIPMRLVVPEVL